MSGLLTLLLDLTTLTLILFFAVSDPIIVNSFINEIPSWQTIETCLHYSQTHARPTTKFHTPWRGPSPRRSSFPEETTSRWSISSPPTRQPSSNTPTGSSISRLVKTSPVISQVLAALGFSHNSVMDCYQTSFLFPTRSTMTVESPPKMRTIWLVIKYFSVCYIVVFTTCLARCRNQ